MAKDEDSVVLCVDRMHTDDDYARRRVEFYRAHADFMERRAVTAERERDEARQEAERFRDAFVRLDRVDPHEALAAHQLPWEGREGGDDGE